MIDRHLSVKPGRLVVAACAAVCALRPVAAQVVVDVGVYGDGSYSSANSVGNGGEMAVQADISGAARAMHWTSAGGMLALGLIPGMIDANALGISADGRVVVGQCGAGSFQAAFRWSSAFGTRQLANPYGGFSAWASATSSDGAIAVGGIRLPEGVTRAVRWNSSGSPQVLGTLFGGSFTLAWALGVSADGLRAVGYSTSAGVSYACMWTTPGSGAVNLGSLPGATSSTAMGVSSGNRCAAVGYATIEGVGSRAFRWTSPGGMAELRTAPEWSASAAYAVSGDGTVVVGLLGTSSSNVAAIWHPTVGMVPLSELLAKRGATLDPAITLESAVSISANGRYVAVRGKVNGASRGLLLDLGNPCWIDMNCDRLVDGADLAELLAQWGPGGAADFDGNGAVDGSDLAAVLNAWGPCGGP